MELETGYRGKLILALPLTANVTAFLLSLLCVISGVFSGFMENYHILRVSYRHIQPSVEPQLTYSAKFTGIKDVLKSIANTIESHLNLDFVGNGILELAEGMGISDFYSLHIPSYCSTNFTNSSTKTMCYSIGLSAYNIKGKVTSIPALARIDNISWLQDLLDGIQSVIELAHWLRFTALVLYAISMALIGISICLLLCKGSRRHLGTWWSGSALFVLLTASTIVTITACVVRNNIDQKLDKYLPNNTPLVHLSGKYLAITWSACACMGIGTLAAQRRFIAIR